MLDGLLMSSQTFRAESETPRLTHFRAALDSGETDLVFKANTSLIDMLGVVNAGRRATLRSAALVTANRIAAQPSAGVISRTVGAWDDVLILLREFADTMTPEIIKELDELVAQLDDPTQSASDVLRWALINGMGFAPAEYEWELRQLERVGFRILFSLSDDDPRVLRALVDAAASGDSGMLQIGFVTTTDSESANMRVRDCIARSRALGVTASLFHLLPALILAAAHLGESHLPLPGLLARHQGLQKIFESARSAA